MRPRLLEYALEYVLECVPEGWTNPARCSRRKGPPLVAETNHYLNSKTNLSTKLEKPPLLCVHCESRTRKTLMDTL